MYIFLAGNLPSYRASPGSHGKKNTLCLRPGDTTQTGFQLPGHTELNLSPAQSAELIADYFSSISQEYAPLDTKNLPPNVQTFLCYGKSTAPILPSLEVLSRKKKAKNTKCNGPW